MHRGIDIVVEIEYYIVAGTIGNGVHSKALSVIEIVLTGYGQVDFIF